MSTVSIIQHQLAPGQVTRARRELIVFFALLIPLTTIAYLMMFLQHLPDFFLLWVPAVSSIVTRLIMRIGFDDVSFRFGGKRTLYTILFGLAFPIIVSAIAYGIAWSFGLAHFAVPIGGVIPKPLPNPSNPTLRFILTLFLSTTLVTLLFSIAYTPGEEIGWRGFMLTRLIESRLPYPVFLQALIWGLWHVPFILSDTYKPGGNPFPVLGLLFFMVSAVSFAYFLAWIRLRTGSIWPSIIAHGAWNAITQVTFDPATSGAMSRLWIGESGLLVGVVTLLAVIAIYQLWPIRELLRKPGQRLEAYDGDR